MDHGEDRNYLKPHGKLWHCFLCRTVTILALDLSILKGSNAHFIRAGNQHIQCLIKKLAHYDALVLQYEPGLYASNLSLAEQRVLRLILKHNNVLLTLHSPLQLDTKISLKTCIKELLQRQFKAAILAWTKVYQQHRTHQFWKKIAKLRHVKIHTHCDQDKNILQQLYGIQQVFDFPHALFSQEEIAAYRAQYNRSAFLKRHNLDPVCKYVAIFGFYGPYKGHVTALKMLRYLPDNYHLLIIGHEHPYNMQPGITVNKYLNDILSLVESPTPNNTLVNRVRFLGHLHNHLVPEFYSVIDYVVLPYFDPLGGQSGSGPAAHALEFNCRTLFSNASVFRKRSTNPVF
jgi:glycosyltransferase involved in cell wall biosynthesis